MRPYGKRLVLLAAFVLFCACCAAPADAGTLSVETGRGFHHSQHAESFFLRYQDKAFEIEGFDAYYEALAGGWNGKNRNEAVALSLGIMLPWHENDWFFGSAGLGRASRTTDNLGVHFQVTFHVGYTMKREPVNLTLGYVHFSTGKYFLGWEGPNYGENFLTLQAGMEF
ncbi:MAG TPA: hypothetical protein VN604_06770 [Nitrospirota bacterium]|nr:hypothetical protein [Nitrospirota bacterium]